LFSFSVASLAGKIISKALGLVLREVFEESIMLRESIQLLSQRSLGKSVPGIAAIVINCH